MVSVIILIIHTIMYWCFYILELFTFLQHWPSFIMRTESFEGRDFSEAVDEFEGIEMGQSKYNHQQVNVLARSNVQTCHLEKKNMA